MFAGPDIAARRICDVRRNRSSVGKAAVSRWTSSTSSTACCHARS